MATPRTRTRTAAADVRNHLIAASRKIIESDGEQALTIRAVATEAGVAPMGIYNHFDGKEGLLSAVVTDAFAELTKAITCTDHDPATRLANSGRGYRAFAIANPSLYALMFSTGCQADEEVAEGSFAVLADIIRFGQAAGLIIDGPAESLALQTWSCVHGAVSLEITESAPAAVDPAVNYENVLALVIRGLARNTGQPGAREASTPQPSAN